MLKTFPVWGMWLVALVAIYLLAVNLGWTKGFATGASMSSPEKTA